jgi:hypothetical protein
VSDLWFRLGPRAPKLWSTPCPICGTDMGSCHAVGSGRWLEVPHKSRWKIAMRNAGMIG